LYRLYQQKTARAYRFLPTQKKKQTKWRPAFASSAIVEEKEEETFRTYGDLLLLLLGCLGWSFGDGPCFIADSENETNKRRPRKSRRVRNVGNLATT
jgi:hypothetical protein